MAGLFSDNLPQTVPDTSFFQNAPPPQMPQNVLPQSPLPITDAQKIPFWQDIILAKKGYGLTEQNLLKLNEMLADPDLKDEDKKKITDQIDLGNKALEGFSKYATGVRNAANAIGLDVSDYGSDKTLAESTQALNNYAATAVRDLFAMPSVAEQEQARFDELVARGVRPSQAHRLVKYDHPKVQGDYERRIRDGIMTYGTNPDGSINEVGLSLMHSALSSSPQTTTLFGTALALPKSVFDANNQRDLAILGSNAALQRTLEQLRVQEAIAKANRESQEKRTAAALSSREKIATQKEDRQDARTEFVQQETNKRTAAEIESRFQLKSMDLQAGTYGFKFADAYETGLKIFNGDHKKLLTTRLTTFRAINATKTRKARRRRACSTFTTRCSVSLTRATKTRRAHCLNGSLPRKRTNSTSSATNSTKKKISKSTLCATRSANISV